MNPKSYVDSIPKTTSVVAITGEKDDNTPPRPTRRYIEDLTERGVAARFILTRGGHYYHSHWRDVKYVIDLAMARELTAFNGYVRLDSD